MRILLVVLPLLCSACRSAVAVKMDEALTRMVPFGMSGSVLVADRGRVILNKGYGDGLRPDTIYDMGSITKSFTAAAILLLENEGKLRTADTLSKFFPDVPAEKANITLDQILSHSAGFIDLTGSDYDPVPREKFLADFFAAPLIAKPGTEYHYSNGGYSLLSAIIENVSGMPYERFMEERLFRPAGMRDTTYRVPKRDWPRVARTLTPPVDHGTPVERLERAGGVHWILLGNGGMLSTTEDLYRWEKVLRGSPILPKLMTPIFKRSETMSLAAAWTIENVAGERVMHHGSDAPELGVNGEYRRYPDHDFTVIFLGNTRVNGWSPRRIVGARLRAIARGEEVRVPRTVHAKDAARYAGTYALGDGSTIEIRAVDGHLVAGAVGQSAVDLLTVQRSEQSLANRRIRNEKALEVARANNLSDVTVLGTSRRDRGVFMTTIRANGKVLRFAWSGNDAVAESDDNQLPHIGIFSESPIAYALERPLRRENGDTFAFYDIYANETIRVTFTGDTMKIGTTEARRSAGVPPAGRAASRRP
jgi:CubicO group peptidase (beta-lactamase class C family)